MLNNNRKFKKGFGILEVLVASVIVITMLSVLVMVGRTALANSTYTQEKAQAIYLAQDGIEIVRQIRDSDWIDRDNTTQFKYVAWYAAITQLAPVATSTTIYYPLYNSNLGHWGLKNKVNSTDTDVLVDNQTYTRKITVSPIIATDTILPGGSIDKENQSFKVTVTVNWNFNNQSKNIQASEILTNWRPNF